MSGSTTPTTAADPTAVVNTLGSVVTPMGSTPKAETKPGTKPEPKAAAAPKGSFTDQILALGQQGWDKPARPNAVQIEPWTKKRPEADPVREFGSWASGLAILAGALTRTPMTTALNASAEAMKAIRAGDLATYEDQKKTWQENIDIAIKNAELQYKAYDLAYKEGRDTYADRMAAITTAATTFHNDGMLRIAQQGAADSHISALQTQTLNGIKIAEAHGEYLDGMMTGQQIYEAEREKNPNLPEWKSLANTPEGRNMQDAYSHRGYVHNVAEAKRLEFEASAKGQQTQDVNLLAKSDFRNKFGREPVPGDPSDDTAMAEFRKTRGGKTSVSDKMFQDNLLDVQRDPAWKNKTLAEQENEAKRRVADASHHKAWVEQSMELIAADLRAQHVGDPAWTEGRIASEATQEFNKRRSFGSTQGRIEAGPMPGSKAWFDNTFYQQVLSDNPGISPGEAAKKAREMSKKADSDYRIISDADARMAADMALTTGNTSMMQSWGRSPDSRAKIFTALREGAQARGMSVEDISMREAEWAGVMQAERSLGVRTATLESANQEAKLFIPMVLEASADVNRTRYPSINTIMLAGETQTGDPKVVKLGVALNALKGAYSQVLTRTGQPTDQSRKKADDVLQAAWSKNQLSAAVQQLEAEINAASQVPDAVQAQLRARMTAGVRPVQTPGAPAAPAPGGARIPPSLPPSLSGKNLQFSPSANQYRDKDSGKIYDIEGNEVK